MRLLIFFFILVPYVGLGQARSRVPSDLPDHIIGAWVDDKEDIVLIISRDYIVIEDQLYSYNDIVTERKKTYFTCVYKYGIKYLNTEKISTSKLYLDTGDNIKVLTKLKFVKQNRLPEFIIDEWYLKTQKIILKEEGILFLDTFYRIDNVFSANEVNYKIIAYHNGVYSLIHNFLNKRGHYLNTNFSEIKIFKKASFFEKYKTHSILLFILLVMLITYYVFRMKIGITKKKEMTKRVLVEMELKSIRSQMNPHFLFNALSAIQNLINKNDTEKANHYLTQFAQLMRLTLDKSEKGVVPLEDELESIQKYLELEKLRFFFNYCIKVDTNVDIYQTEIPAMLIQPYVENAIIHGLKETEGEKHLILKFEIVKGSLLSIIEDNGIGINATLKEKKNLGIDRAPYGLKLAEDRIQLIKDSYKTDVEIKIVDLSAKDSKLTGTRVEIRLPLKY